MKSPSSATIPTITPTNSTADRPGERPRYWLRITGLPGWKRRLLGLPAFGTARCLPRPQ